MILWIIIGILFFLILAGMIFASTSYSRLIKAYNKYDNAFTYTNMSGLEFAKFAIPKLKLKTQIAFTDTPLGDYYSPKKDVMVISRRSAQNRSIASVCITAHELGHAVQKKTKSKIYIIQRIFVFLTIAAKFLFVPLFVAGIVLLFFEQYFEIGKIMIIVALISLLFSYFLKIVTIPVEYNASKIAYKFLKENHVFDEGELKAAKRMLNVAAETYIASLFMGIIKFFKNLGKSFSR